MADCHFGDNIKLFVKITGTLCGYVLFDVRRRKENIIFKMLF